MENIVSGTDHIRDKQAFSTKGKIGNILGFAGHSNSFVTAQLCYDSVLALKCKGSQPATHNI